MTQTTLHQWLNTHAPALEAQLPDARRVLRQLAAFRLETSEALLLFHQDRRITPEQARQLLEDVAHLRRGKPLAWLYGFQPFLDWDFLSDARALTPRPETEALVSWVIEQFRGKHPPARILDLCCGSGVMGLALGLAFPNAVVHLTDICPDALSLCRENIDKHNLGERTKIYEGDLWRALGSKEQYDLIVANPPYVAHNDPVEAGVLAHEPHLALFSDDKGMRHIKRILVELPDHLTARGLAAFELGHEHHQLLQPWLDLRADHGQFVFREDPFGVPRYLIYTQAGTHHV